MQETGKALIALWLLGPALLGAAGSLAAEPLLGRTNAEAAARTTGSESRAATPTTARRKQGR